MTVYKEKEAGSIDQIEAIPRVIRSAIKGLGSIELRPIFGEKAVFCEDIMFLWIVDGRCYIRQSPELSVCAREQGWQPLTRIRPDGQPITFGYYDVNDLLKIAECDPIIFILSSLRKARLERDFSINFQKNKVSKAAERCLRLPSCSTKGEGGVTEGASQFSPIDAPVCAWPEPLG